MTPKYDPLSLPPTGGETWQEIVFGPPTLLDPAPPKELPIPVTGREVNLDIVLGPPKYLIPMPPGTRMIAIEGSNPPTFRAATADDPPPKTYDEMPIAEPGPPEARDETAKKRKRKKPKPD